MAKKPAPLPIWTGTAGPDTVTLTDSNLSLLTTKVHDGSGGIDTLNLTGTTIGITLQAGTLGTSRVSLSEPFQGIFWSLEHTGKAANVKSDTIRNFEIVLGGSGNDRLVMFSPTGTLDGGPGNDALDSTYGAHTLIGGAGEDWIKGSNNDIMVGGAWSNRGTLPAGDNATDWFVSGGTVLDFDLGMDGLGGDHLVLDVGDNVAQVLSTPWQPANWADGSGAVHQAAKLVLNGTTLFTLVGVTPAQADAFVTPNITFAVIVSGPEPTRGVAGHDDILLPSNDVDPFVLELGGGDDTIVYPKYVAETYTPNEDSIVFPLGLERSAWSSITVNGQQGWYSSFGSAQDDSITILGLTLAQVEQLTARGDAYASTHPELFLV